VLDRPELELEAVLDRLVASAEASTTQSGRALYVAWFDTNNDAASAVDPAGLHCSPTLNGFPMDCPRQEGELARRAANAGADDPLAPGRYHLVAVAHRFDKAAVDGSTCGQYRLSYGFEDNDPPADPDQPDFDYLILEGVLANPTPALGVAGCLPVAQYLAAVDAAPDADSRAALVEQFFFDGLPGFDPIVSWRSFRGEPSGSGQLRTNQFLLSEGGQPWQAREYTLDRVGSSPADYRLVVTPATVKDVAYGRFFSTAGGGPLTADFQAWFIDQAVAGLAAASDVNDLAMDVPPQFEPGQSTQPGLFEDADEEIYVGDYVAQAEDNPALLAAIQARLDAIGSTLTPLQIVARAEVTTCAGCHQLSSASPASRDLGGAIAESGGYLGTGSLGFVHTAPFLGDDDADGDMDGYRMSDALRTQFLPHRAAVLEAFVSATCSSPPPPPPTTPAAPDAPRTNELRRVRAIGGGLARGH
jgi:hypothetical protein